MSDPEEVMQSGIRCAADILRGSRRTVVLSGAGISTPSGIPDFRSAKGGLWSRYDPFEVASLSAFRYQPEKFYNWMRQLANTIYFAAPNPAHIGLAQLEQADIVQTIITQNIDALHQRAGSRNVLEVHGSFDTMTCIWCFRKTSSEDYIQPYLEYGQIPRCPDCSHVLKPDMVLFGEQLPMKTWLAAEKASKDCDVMIVVGSSLEVLPVAGLPMRALENGAHLILINHMETYLDVRADVLFHDGVEVIIPRIVEEVLG